MFIYSLLLEIKLSIGYFSGVLMVGVWGRLLGSCVSGMCKWWILVFSIQFEHISRWLISEKCTCNILVMTCCFMGHWMPWCPHSCVSCDIWGTYFWKETQVCFWQELNFDYAKLRNKWMCEKSRNYLIYFAVAQWLRCCATNQKVAGSIPGCVSGFFIDIKPFRSHYGPGVDSASNRNECKEYFLG